MSKWTELRDIEQQGTTYYCPNCLHGIRLALPIEPIYTGDTVAALVPCTIRWLRNQHKYVDIIGEPIYMLDDNRRRHRVYTATAVRNLRLKRLAQFSRRRNKMVAPYERPTNYPQGEPSVSGEGPSAS